MFADIKKILVTGSNGIIGTRLCESLIEKGIDFIGIDIKNNAWNIEVGKKTIILDIRDPEELKELPYDIDFVIHLAANSRVYDLIGGPSGSLENIVTSFNILEFCRERGIKRFMFASSREIYGNVTESSRKEECVDLILCENPYAASKIAGEALANAYNNCYGIENVILRFSNVYGMYDSYTDRIIPLFIRKSLRNQDLTVFGKDKVLDFIHIDDCIQSVIMTMENFDSAKGMVYNIGSGEGTSLIKAAEDIVSIIGSDNDIKIKENRKGEVSRFVADISKARKILGCIPEYSFENGIRKAINWHKSSSDLLTT